MEDYIREGLMMRKAPISICGDIERRLQSPNITKKERKNLEKQLEKARKMVNETSIIFGRI